MFYKPAPVIFSLENFIKNVWLWSEEKSITYGLLAICTGFDAPPLLSNLNLEILFIKSIKITDMWKVNQGYFFSWVCLQVLKYFLYLRILCVYFGSIFIGERSVYSNAKCIMKVNIFYTSGYKEMVQMLKKIYFFVATTVVYSMYFWAVKKYFALFSVQKDKQSYSVLVIVTVSIPQTIDIHLPVFSGVFSHYLASIK